MVYPKIRAGVWSFSYYQERWYFFFPKIWSYSLDTKGKMIFFKKNTWKYDIFFKCSEKMVFPKDSRLNMIFFVISGKMVFHFSRKYDIFSLGGKWKKMIFIKKRVEIWHFLYKYLGVTGMTLPSWQKKKMPRKNTPEVDISGITEKDDIHPRLILDSSYFCWNTTFMDTLERTQEAATGDILQEKVFLEISQNSQGKTCARASFLIKLQT